MDDTIHYDEEIQKQPRENGQYWQWIPDLIRSWVREERVLSPPTPNTTTSSWTLPTLRYSPKQASVALVAPAVEQDHIQDQGLEPAAESAAIAVEQDPVEDQEQESVMANESKTNEVEGGQEEQEEETSAQVNVYIPIIEWEFLSVEKKFRLKSHTKSQASEAFSALTAFDTIASIYALLIRSASLNVASPVKPQQYTSFSIYLFLVFCPAVYPYEASISGEKIDAAEELDASSSENNGVPNPLFDLAGIMCGQFGIPFWKFFFATLFGKAIVKTHIQTVFIISVCNNQLLYWIENELIWMLSFIPGVASALPNIVAKLHAEKYMAAPLPVTSNIKVKSWGLSFASIWNSIVWLMLFNFFVKIVNSTAQRYLKKQQENEICALKKKLDEDQDIRKLNETRKTLAEVEVAHASASNVVAAKKKGEEMGQVLVEFDFVSTIDGGNQATTEDITQVKSWGLSFASIWNSIVWLMLFNFFVKFVNSTAQRYLKKHQENEICALKKKLDEDQDSH
ncbi:hypothetical protein E3N88_28382 [Mikania micrantha]|uniref:Uncharacterized protein n=1 Tax=Mikania micrantha TaxID=192012 RepID=A0A5N6MZW3_9ASTR|nr:hypothetical protein E3N88_28382 [Mikania micrantha]